MSVGLLHEPSVNWNITAWIEFGTLFVLMPVGFLFSPVRIPKIPALLVMTFLCLSLLLTIPGGYLLSATYSKTKSLLVTGIEHAIYGNLVFTVGLGFYFYN